jgi:hypothetical protein
MGLNMKPYCVNYLYTNPLSLRATAGNMCLTNDEVAVTHEKVSSGFQFPHCPLQVSEKSIVPFKYLKYSLLQANSLAMGSLQIVPLLQSCIEYWVT